MSKAAFIELVAGLDKKNILSKADAKPRGRQEALS